MTPPATSRWRPAPARPGISEAESRAWAAANAALNRVAVDLERTWGVNRLPELVAPDLAAKFATAQEQCDEAIRSGDTAAAAGKATALVGMRTGYASSVVYTLVRSPSLSLAYDVKSLPPGSYNPADYNAVLLEPGITNTVVIKVDLVSAKNAAALFAAVGRLPLTPDGYVAIAGSAATESTDFTGTTWRSGAQQGLSTLRLEPLGVATLRTPSTTQTGQWKVAGNALQLLFETDVRYSLALSADGRFLDGDIRRKEWARPNFPGAPAAARHDDADDDLRFKSPRFYKLADTGNERTAAAKRESAIETAQQ